MTAATITPVTPAQLPEHSDWWSKPEVSERKWVVLGLGQAAIDKGLDTLQLEMQQNNAERARAIHEGWKLHFGVDLANTDHVKTVRRTMQTIMEADQMVTYKIGEGGGEVHDAPGKEVTVYVGSLKGAKRVASNLEGALHGIILPARGDVLVHDVPLSPHATVWGRFDVERTQPIEHSDPMHLAKYGFAGVSAFSGLHNRYNPATEQQVIEQVTPFLTGLYGTYFDDGTLAEMQANRTAFLVANKGLDS